MRVGLTAPAGNPSALAGAVDRYEATERAIAAAADDLARIVMDGQGDSMDAVREKATKARTHLEQAHGRYSGTRSALRAYTVELQRYHQATNTAIEHDHAARAEAADAGGDLESAARHARSAAMNPSDQATIDYWDTQAHLARHRKDVAESAMAAALGDYQRAADALDSAAQLAISLIEASFDGTNDSNWDEFAHAVASVASFLSSLADWVADFFEGVFEAIALAIAVVVTAVIVAIAVVALIIVIIQLVIVAILLIEIALLVILNILRAGVMAYDVATLLGVDDLTRIRMVLVAISLACPALGLYIESRIANELGKPAPTVTELDERSLAPGSDQLTALQGLEASTPDSLSDFLAQAGAVDAIGASDQSVVDIAKIVHEDGTVAWIVTVPSTMDWVFGGDKGAVNDFDADLVLLAFPELRTQFEKAVLDAMAQAGIGADEPVLMTGWSLGGILSGELIQSGAGGYHYSGLVVAGSPIDHMAIPDSIPVVQVKHEMDPVHRTDMIDQIPDTSTHVSLWDGDRSGIGIPMNVSTTVAHNAILYTDTLDQHVKADQTLNDNFRDFFVVDDPNHTGQPTIEHTQYAFSE